MEIGATLEMCMLCTFVCMFMYHEPEALSYEIFM